MLNLAVDPAALTTLIETIAASCLAKMRDEMRTADDRLAFDEGEAARLIGLERHQLRDERLRGRISASRITKGSIRYLRQDLEAYLMRDRLKATH